METCHISKDKEGLNGRNCREFDTSVKKSIGAIPVPKLRCGRRLVVSQISKYIEGLPH